MKQTAVEWLQEALSLTFEQEMKFEGLFQQAKEMEKQQIIESIDETNSKWRSQKAEIILTGNHYYNQNFKNK